MSRRLLDPVTQVELILPDGISNADAIEHARRRRAGGLRQLRVFPEWGLDCSLWTTGGAVDLEHFDITPSLASRLRAWTAKWEALGSPFDAEDRTDLDELNEWRREGLTIATDLQRELYATTVVVPEFGGLRGKVWEFSQP